MTLKPAPVNTGIIFRRVDLNPVVEFTGFDNVGDTTFLQLWLTVTWRLYC